MTSADTVVELAALLNTARGALLKDEHDALVATVTSQVRRMGAERDGWKAIAVELLTIAFGEDNALGDGATPPLEIIELRAIGKLPTQMKPALEQFWHDLTRRHAVAREEAQRRIDERIDADSLDGWERDLGIVGVDEDAE